MLAALYAILIAVGALVVRLLAAPWLPEDFPFITFFPATLLATLLLGWRAGALSAIAGAVLAWAFLITPSTQFALAFDRGALVALVVYSVIVAVEILLIHWLQAFIILSAEERERSRHLAETRELLFRELQHRISNNLQMVAGLLRLHRSEVKDPAALAVLDDAAARLALIGKIGRQLHDPGGAPLGVGQFLEGLCTDLVSASGRQDISLHCDVPQDFTLDPEVAIPVALIVAESVSNAIEHGLPDGSAGAIDVVLERSGPDRMTLEVRDSGKGPPQGFSLAKNQSLGLRIAQLLSRQLGGEFALVREDRTIARLVMPG